MLSILIILITAVVVWLYLKLGNDKLRQYEEVLGLQKANLVYAEDYQKVADLILPTRQTAFKKHEPVIWLYKNDGRELFLGANYKGDVRIWLKSQSVLEGVHIVLDGMFNNSRGSNLIKDKLPKQPIRLEGNFAQHFRLYCNQGQQVLALQIIAPNIMSYLLDNLLLADIEIIDGQVAIIIKKGASSLERLKAGIDLAEHIDKLSNAASKVTKL